MNREDAIWLAKNLLLSVTDFYKLIYVPDAEADKEELEEEKEERQEE